MSSDTNGKHPLSYNKSGLYELKRSVLVLGRRTIDNRSTVGKALKAWRLQLLADLGGMDSISTQEAALIDAAVKTKLILDSVDAWLLSQPSLINKRSRSVLSAVHSEHVPPLQHHLRRRSARGLPPRRETPRRSAEAEQRRHPQPMRTRTVFGHSEQQGVSLVGQPLVLPTPRAGLEPATIRLTAGRSTD